ncbi:hypothetical protein [Nocardiopsis sp. FR26]|uniref:hypothetical protein n=1 Tax=Nocardiopsis sp. FR26 TaxID=2605987 RepID=UPI00135677C8|nr:hypothetical protein [Nocardiopsis sp. FR26]
MTRTNPRDNDDNEPVNFEDVQIGDTLTFCNRDNGFGGSGNRINRTGVVTGKTEKTVTVKVTGHNPLAVGVFTLNSRGHGKEVTYGATARLRASTWNDRQVRRVEAEQPADEPTAESYDGEWGVFNDEGCTFVGSRAEAEAQAAKDRAADDGHWAELISVHRICPDHEEQPKDACEECLTYAQDDGAEEEPVHMREGSGTLCGETGPDTAGTGHVNCEGCLDKLADEADRIAQGITLCPVYDVPDSECGCSLHEDAEESPAEGRVIAHQGTGRGVAPEHSDNPAARAAIAVLAAAGLSLADLPETYDPDTSTANGFMVEPRDGAEGPAGEMVYVYYLNNGQTTDPSGEFPRDELRNAQRALRDAGWGVEPRISRCVRACQVHEDPAPQHDHSVAEGIVRAVEQRNAPAPLPKRTPGATRIQDAADRHHGVDPDRARKIAATLGTAGFNALQSADEDGYLTAGHPASLKALARDELVVQAEHPAAGGGPRTYRITELGRVVARMKSAALADPTPEPKKPRAHRIPVKHADTPTGRTYTAACRDCDHTVGPYDIRAIAEERAASHRSATARTT